MRVVVRGAVAGVVAAAAVGLAVTSGSASAEAGWTAEPVPPRPDTSSILTSAASGDGVTWAFGGWYTGWPIYSTQAYLRGADGWTEQQTPDIGRPTSSAVLSRDNVWVIGQEGKVGTGTSMHWDGKAWTEFPVAPVPPNHYQGVSRLGVAGADVWAVGSLNQAGRASSGRGTAQRWDGKAWVEVVPPGPSEIWWTLTGIGGSGSEDVWAIGRAGEYGQGPGKPLAFHWDGKAWTEFPMPPVDGAANSQLMLVDVHAAAPNDVWAAGSVRDADPNKPSKPVMFHWDGTQWSAVKLPVDAGEINDLVRTGDTLWAIGAANPLRHNGTDWQAVDAPQGGNLLAGTAIDGDKLLGVGYNGSTTREQPFASVYSE
ncbi:hypothetical protein EV193_103299 [Herbihabitans rhizosphaerae]|uniref:Galactose oxidase-like protein n=1 Tax=Herbihabitans rhizosphaerae TaxID=1872711 RepID=A0A4Q7KY81_9PSEU|nr:hypothetical protein [Herbihabitans rhizosphaerae]RZS40981.1 hypothetical protein EV193_103299 [Herbihabitans rhizosphaerae]